MKQNDLDSFLAERENAKRYGRRFTLDRTENAEGIIAEALKFNERREQGTTSVPWREFVRGFLIPKLGYTGDERLLRYYLEHRLNVKTH